MGFAAQGTIQVEQHAGGKTVVLFSPISDYRVRHKTKDHPVKEYTVFVGDDDRTALIFPVEATYEIDESLSTVLIQAAFKQTKIRVEIEKKGPAGRIVGLLVPATPPPL